MVSRDELYRLVWSQPLTKVAVELHISGSYLARVCVALRVPRPERGYWAKLRAGKAPPVPTLPASRAGDLLEWTKDVALPAVAPPKADLDIRPNRRARRRCVSGTHELIGGARKHFEASRKSEEGEYLRPYKRLLVDITVSKAQLLRTLEFANALFNALEAEGHRVMLAHRGLSLSRLDFDEREVPTKRVGERYPRLWSPGGPTVVYVGEVPVGLALVELSEAVLMRYVNGTYVRDADYAPPKARRNQPDYTWTSTQDVRSGRLRLIVYAPRHDTDCSLQWQETKGAELRNQIPGIVAAMPRFAIEVAARVRAAELAWKRKWQEYDEAEQRRQRTEDRERAQASHDESRRNLEKLIADWANALSVDRFFSEIEERAALLPEDMSGPILNRLALARGFIGSLDPMRFFLAWRTPLEIYQPVYEQDLASSETNRG